MTASRGRLNVRHFHADYLVPAGHPAPERVRWRLDEAVRRNLADTLRAALAPWLEREDESVWFVRRVEVDLDVNAGWDRQRIAKEWTTQIAQTLAHVVAVGRNGSGAGVVWFPNRTTYLARFLADLAVGDAWGKWYYQPFDGLRMLPASAVLRTAISEDPDLGLRALLELDDAQRERVLATITALDAQRVLDAMPAGVVAGDSARCRVALRRAWSTQSREPPSRGEEARTGLDLYLRVCREDAGLSGPGLRDATRALVRLARLVAERSADRANALLRALVASDPAALYVVAGSDAEVLRPFRDAPAQWIRDLEQVLTAPRSSQQRGTPEEDAGNFRQRDTPFGGAFLLLPFLDRLPLERATETWTPAGNTPAVAVVRLLLLAKCLDPARAARIFGDPLLRDLLEIEPALSLRDVRRWASGLSAVQVDVYLSALAEWCREHQWPGVEIPDVLEGEDPSLRGLLARRHHLPADFDHLAVPRSFGLPRTVDLALSVAGCAILRTFAARLPGFAGSSFPHLRANFLSIAARVQGEPERYVVWLGKPPLQLVLGLGGLGRGEYRVSWLPNRPFALFGEEG